MSPFDDSPEGQTHSFFDQPNYDGEDRCRGCKEPIRWIRTRKRKLMPVNPQRTTIVTIEGDTVWGYVPHWGTCIAAGRFKKK